MQAAKGWFFFNIRLVWCKQMLIARIRSYFLIGFIEFIYYKISGFLIIQIKWIVLCHLSCCFWDVFRYNIFHSSIGKISVICFADFIWIDIRLNGYTKYLSKCMSYPYSRLSLALKIVYFGFVKKTVSVPIICVSESPFFRFDM